MLSLGIWGLISSFASPSYKEEIDYTHINGKKDDLKEYLIEMITSERWLLFTEKKFYEIADSLMLIIPRDDDCSPPLDLQGTVTGLDYTDEEKNTFKQKFEKLAEDLKNNIKDRKDAHRKCSVLEYGEEKVAKWEKMIDEAIKQRNAEQKES